MVCVINTADLGTKGVMTNCVTEGIPRHASLSQIMRIEEYDNEIEILAPSGQANTVEAYTVNAMPKTDLITQFLYSYWWIVALIILGIIAVNAI